MRSRRADRARPSADTGRAPPAGSPTSGAAARRCGCRPSGPPRRPAGGCPRQIRIVVVLPAPLAPRKPKIRPLGTLKLSSSRARVCANRLVTRSITRVTVASIAVGRTTSPLVRRSGVCDDRSRDDPDPRVRRLRSGHASDHAREDPRGPRRRDARDRVGRRRTRRPMRSSRCAGCVRAPTAGARPGCPAGSTATRR